MNHHHSTAMRATLGILTAAATIVVSASCSQSNHSTSQGDSTSRKPQSQQAAIDGVVANYRRTIEHFPAGTTFDSTRYGGHGYTIDCDDNAMGDEVSPVSFQDARDMNVPAGTDINTLVDKLGDVWKSFGWKVVEKDGAPKPNRYATTPDGYTINAVRGYPIGYPPTLGASSPCFDGNLKNSDLGAPAVIESHGQVS